MFRLKYINLATKDMKIGRLLIEGAVSTDDASPQGLNRDDGCFMIKFELVDQYDHQSTLVSQASSKIRPIKCNWWPIDLIISYLRCTLHDNLFIHRNNNINEFITYLPLISVYFLKIMILQMTIETVD